MIRVRGLAKTYADGKRALDGVDLDVGEGMLGLLGPNGAGKTTLLSLLVLRLEPTAGERHYGSLDARRAHHRTAIRRMVGYLPQDFEPIRHLTGREYLLHCARLRGVRVGRRELHRRAEALLEAVELQSAQHRRSGEYSGGMRRRLGIAQALIHAPRVVVVDEPTAGLDPEERIRFRNLIADVAEETAVLLSTHVVEDIEATCPRIVVIASGRILHDGSPAELLERVRGRTWELPVRAPLPPDALRIGRRASAAGEASSLVVADRRPDGGAAREASLEEAYSAFLVEHGCAEMGAP